MLFRSVYYSPDPNREAIFADRDYSPDTARIIDEEVKRLIDSAFAETERIIDEHWDKVEAVANALLKYETLQGEELQAIMRGESIDRTSVSDLLDKEAEATSSSTSTPDEEPDATASDGALPSPA